MFMGFDLQIPHKGVLWLVISEGFFAAAVWVGWMEGLQILGEL